MIEKILRSRTFNAGFWLSMIVLAQTALIIEYPPSAVLALILGIDYMLSVFLLIIPAGDREKILGGTR